MDLSIIIPAWNEAKKIEKDIQAVSSFLDQNRLKGEIIVVDDGSDDETTIIAKKTNIPSNTQLNIVRYENHRGKGYAIRQGMNKSQGKFVMFADSGLCVPYQFVLKGIDLIKNGECEIAHGSRKLPESIIVILQKLSRQISTKLFRWMVILWMKIPSYLSDTQCGFKIYKGDIARELYDKCQTDGFMFDIEIILLALQKGYRIKEFAIEWKADHDSRLSLKRNFRPIIKELSKIGHKIQKT